MVDFRIQVVVDPRQAQTGSRRVRRELERTENRADRLRASLARAFAAATVGVGLVQSVRLLAEFEQQMSTVQAITQATEAEFAALDDTAQRLGATTRFSASEAAEGMVFLARAGFEANEVLGSIEGTLQLAQAGALSLGSAADIASNVLTGFRLEVDQTGRVVDVLALAANSANTDVQQLGDALKFVAPVAAGVGVSIEEATAAIGALSNAGLQGSLAGTGLRRVISELESPSNNTANALKSLQVGLDEVRISEVGLTAALERLAEAGVDTGLALELFGDRGGPAFEVLRSSIGDVRELTGELQRADGTAERIAETMDDNLNGALLALRSAFQGLVLAVGDGGASGALRTAVESITDSLRFLTDNIELVVAAGEALAVLLILRLAGQAIPAAIAAIGRLTVAIAANPIGFLVTALTTGIALLVGFRNELTLAGDSAATFGDFLAVGFEHAGEVLETFRALFEETLAGLDDSFAGAFDGFEFTLRDFLILVGVVVDSTVGLFVGMGNAIRAALSELPAAAADFGLAFINGLLDLIEGGIDRIVAAFQTLGVQLGSIVLGVVNSMRLLGEAANFSLAGDFETASERAQEAAQALANGVEGAFSNIGATFDSKLLANQLDDLIPEVENQFSGAALGLGQKVSEAFVEGLNFDATQGFVEGVLVAAEERAAARQRELAAQAQANAIAAAQAGNAAADNAETDLGLPPDLAPDDPDGPNALSEEFQDQAAILEQIRGPMEDYERTVAALDALFAEGKITAEEYGLALTQVEAAALGLDNSISGGLSAGFAQIQLAASDTAGVVAQGLTNAFGAAKDALVDFARTGELSFEGLVSTILDGLAELATQQLLSSLIGGAGGGGGLFGSIFSFFGGARQGGGPVDPDHAFLVGEEGPELFTPESAGNITPAGETAALLGAQQSDPVVNVDVQVAPAPVTVIDDQQRVLRTMRSRQGREAQLGNLRADKRASRGTIS